MWHWIRDHRREKILEAPFSASWIEILEKNLPHYRRLPEPQRAHLRDLLQVFIAEKNWEACGGFRLSDEVKVIIAAQACLLVLNLPHDFYTDVQTILVYPSVVLTPARKTGLLESGAIPILGQAQVHGPVILVWDSILQTARHPEAGHNVVYHEFAHKLDMFNGHPDGTPPIENAKLLQRWVEVCSTEFLALRAATQKGRRTFLDSYAAVSEAEFFAVITEQFFDQPYQFQKQSPKLYEVLQEFYRQDPAALELK